MREVSSFTARDWTENGNITFWNRSPDRSGSWRLHPTIMGTYKSGFLCVLVAIYLFKYFALGMFLLKAFARFYTLNFINWERKRRLQIYLSFATFPNRVSISLWKFVAGYFNLKARLDEFMNTWWSMVKRCHNSVLCKALTSQIMVQNYGKIQTNDNVDYWLSQWSGGLKSEVCQLHQVCEIENESDSAQKIRNQDINGLQNKNMKNIRRLLHCLIWNFISSLSFFLLKHPSHMDKK